MSRAIRRQIKRRVKRILAIINQKGGVGKSALALALSAALAAKGKRVLLVDLDPTGHATRGLTWSVTGEIQAREQRGLPIPKELTHLARAEQDEQRQAEQEGREPELQELYRIDGFTLFQALVPEAVPAPSKKQPRPQITPQQLIRALPGEQFDLLPAHEEMAASLQQWLSNVPNGEHRIRDFLNQIEEEYDYVVIDSPPDLGPITDGILDAASDDDAHGTVQSGDGGILVPLQADTESVNALDQLYGQIASLEQVLQIHVETLASIVNIYEDNKFSRKVLDKLKGVGDNIHLAPFVIRKRNIIRDAYDAGQTVFTFWPEQRHQQADIQDLRKWFTQLADHMDARFTELENVEVTA